MQRNQTQLVGVKEKKKIHYHTAQNEGSPCVVGQVCLFLGVIPKQVETARAQHFMSAELS